MRPGWLQVLAQGGTPQSGGGGGSHDTTGVFVWVGILIAVVLVGFIVMMFLRKRMFSADTMDQNAGFMDSLREMRNSGQMSQEEFDAARKAMTSRLAGVRGAEGGGVGSARPASMKTQRGPESG